MEEKEVQKLKRRLSPKQKADKKWYLSLLDRTEQFAAEERRLFDVLLALKAFRIRKIVNKIKELEAEKAELRGKEGYSAADYRAILETDALIAAEKKKLSVFKCFFREPYFARMDVVDEKEGYNAYYIGKKGDTALEIVDWRAPLAVRYYQKSRVSFTIGEYEYKTVLRRAFDIKNGKLIDYKNEYLSVKEALTPEEIAGRDEEILYDPFLSSIIKSRKDDTKIRDIIETIQEKQFEMITRPERESFVLQGCAGSGKTMILLHRLSYLMYNNENLRPRDVLVITPSDSFNAFIDELSEVLELTRVRTITLQSYFFQVLKNEEIDLKARLTGLKESEGYLSYLYGEKFIRDVSKDVKKLYEGMFGLLRSEECKEVAEQVLADLRRRLSVNLKIKNASLRVRRAVFGELKESADGGFAFTKPFRALTSAFVQAEDFLKFALEEEPRTPDYFFRAFAEFYKSAKYISSHAVKVFMGAREDLKGLIQAAEKELSDLKRYRVRAGNSEEFTYPDRIAARKELIAEAERTILSIDEMEKGISLFGEFFAVLNTNSACRELGLAKSKLDVTRFLYKKTVKKYKTKFGLKGIVPSDGYALTAVLSVAGRKLTPRYGIVFIDEGQDVSRGEYELLKSIHEGAAFNVFGDLKQRITPFRGISDWSEVCDNVYELSRNYRNTNEIVEYVTNCFPINMQPIGIHGEAVRLIGKQAIAAFFREATGLKAVICREEALPLFKKRGYRPLGQDGKLSKTKINVLTVYESKGLEFSSVAVYAAGMTENEKYIAFTRALKRLAVVE